MFTYRKFTYGKLGEVDPLCPLAYRFKNLEEGWRRKTNEELYEGWIRSDFSNNPVSYRKFDEVVIVRLTISA